MSSSPAARACGALGVAGGSECCYRESGDSEENLERHYLLCVSKQETEGDPLRALSLSTQKHLSFYTAGRVAGHCVSANRVILFSTNDSSSIGNDKTRISITNGLDTSLRVPVMQSMRLIVDSTVWDGAVGAVNQSSGIPHV